MAIGARKTAAGKCSVCEAPLVEQYRPFCSARCANVDLGRWLTGRYVVSGSEDADEDGGMAHQNGAFDEIEDQDDDKDQDFDLDLDPDLTRH